MAMKAGEIFAVSDAAKRRILSLSRQLEVKIGKSVVPAILWLDSDLNDGAVESQPAIGFYDDRTEIEKHITEIDGIEIVLAISKDDEERFRGKTLDYVNDRFVLRQHQ
jgi:hypothetical protein